MAKVVSKTEVVTSFLCVALTNMIVRMFCLVFERKSVIIQSRREKEDSKEIKIGLASLTPLANDIFTISPGVHIRSDTHNWLCSQWSRERDRGAGATRFDHFMSFFIIHSFDLFDLKR